MSSSKSRGIKLEWHGSILEQNSFVDSKKITLKNQNPQKQKNESENKTVSFKDLSLNSLHIRKEKKKRSGHPVLIIFGFTSKDSDTLIEQTCSQLKKFLACGGTIEAREIILQYSNMEKLQEAIKNLYCFG